jgi:hypothetical protein
MCFPLLLPLVSKPHMNHLSVAGHRPGPETHLRDRHFHRIRAALRTSARVHGTPGLAAEAAVLDERSALRVRVTCAPVSRAYPAVRAGRADRQRARATCAWTRRGCVLRLSARRETGRRACGDGTGQTGFLLDDPSLEKMLLEVCGEDGC